MQTFQLFVTCPALIVVIGVLFQVLWTSENVFPLYMKKETGLNLALKCIVASTIPLAISIFIVTLYKILKLWGLFLETNEKILQNTLEQNILFIINLLGSVTLSYSADRMLIITSMYLIGRLVYWLGYIFEAYLKISFIKLFGFLMTFGNTLLLMYFNLKSLV
jgi:uncharacterized MAPEG superfamily protein